MKFKPKPTYFTMKDLELIIEFDRLLEQELIKIQKDMDLKIALKVSEKLQLKPLCLKQSFSLFLADFKASRSK